MNKRLRYIIVLTLLISTALVAAPAGLAAGDKVTVHNQPDGGSPGLGVAAWGTFDNPDYYYVDITTAPAGTYYRQAGFSPDGTKIVAGKQWVDGSYTRREVVLMNADGSGEVVISPGDSGEGDIYQYGNAFWSDDGTAIGFGEAHNANPNKIVRYDIAGTTRTYIYEPAAPLDAQNCDFLGSSKTSIVCWDWIVDDGAADLFIWDGSARTYITRTASYSEYEPISNADGTKIVYWSGETTTEPVDTTHTLTYSGGVWTKDVGFTPITDSYWSYWTSPAATQIAVTVMSSNDVHLYDSTGVFVADLTGPGYSGGGGQWNFVGSMPQGANGEFAMTSNAGRILSGRDIVIAAPLVEPVWAKYSGNPVVTGSMAFDPSVLNDGGTYKMWYTHVDNSGNWTIYYADSADGITWSNQQSVLTPGASDSWEGARVAGPTVIKDGASSYKMWYMGRDASGKEEIGYATSSDGTTWTKDAGNPVLKITAPGWDSLKVRDPSVILDGGVYKMWYSGCAIWPVFKIGYATSSDGIAWTKHASNPVFTGTSGGWDGFQVYAPSVVLDAGVYHMYFSGTDANMSQRWSTGHATSGDGIVWTEAARNPVLIPDGTDDSADYVSAMNDSGTWKLWYSYGGTYAIGLATLDYSTQLYLDPAIGSIPNDNTTTQAYTVRIANAADLYGYQFVITFDPTNIECTAAAFIDTFLTNPLAAPSSWNAYIDNTSGKVYFAHTRQSPDLPVSGSGPLALVTLRSKAGAAAGSYKIGFEQNKLGDIDGNALTHTAQYAWLTLKTAGVGTISGLVDLQGRTDESGGTVTVSNSIGYIQSITIINADGTWSFSGIPVGSYQVNIEMARYLDAQKGASGSGVTVTSGGTTTLAKVKLLGGDANDDDVVDILDAGIIGGQFGKSGGSIGDVRADINADGLVDILDLVLMGGNYAKISPVPWP